MIRGVEADDIALRPLRWSDLDEYSETFADWAPKVVDGNPIPHTPASMRQDHLQWMTRNHDESGRAFAALNRDAAAGCASGDVVGFVRWLHVETPDGPVATDLVLALHPAHRSSAGRCSGHYRALHELLMSHYVGGGIYVRADLAILPTAAAVQSYAQRDGWVSKGAHVGETGLEVADVAITPEVFAAAVALTPRLTKATRQG